MRVDYRVGSRPATPAGALAITLEARIACDVNLCFLERQPSIEHNIALGVLLNCRPQASRLSEYCPVTWTKSASASGGQSPSRARMTSRAPPGATRSTLSFA